MESTSLLESPPKSPQNQGRNHLRWSITGSWVFGVAVLFFSTIFLSTSYGYVNHHQPIYLTPYSISEDQNDNGTVLESCIYPRLNQSYEITDIPCGDGGYCPLGWSCNILTNPQALICNNINFPCPNDAECYQYISNLPQTNIVISTASSTVIGSESDVDVKSGNFISCLVMIYLVVLATILVWTLIELRLLILGDPLADQFNINLQLPGGFLSVLGDKYTESKIGSFIESNPRNLYLISTIGFLTPLTLIAFISCVVFLTGIEPALPKLSEYSDCVNDHYFYEVTTGLVGWAVFLIVVYICTNICLAILLALYLTESLFKFWRSHIFFFVCGLLSIVVILGVVVALIDAI